MTTASIIWLVFMILAVGGITAGFVWLAAQIKGITHDSRDTQDFIARAEGDVERIFNNEFREELKNRGRLHFEQIINENAMFLKQDLQLTATQLNEYMQDSIKRVLKEEFAKYEESIDNANQLAVEAIEKTQQVLEEQRERMSTQLIEEVRVEKKRILDKFEQNMQQVVNYYLLESIGSEIDLSDQMDYIFRQLEDNKQAIIEDIESGS